VGRGVRGAPSLREAATEFMNRGTRIQSKAGALGARDPAACPGAGVREKDDRPGTLDPYVPRVLLNSSALLADAYPNGGALLKFVGDGLLRSFESAVIYVTRQRVAARSTRAPPLAPRGITPYTHPVSQ
jgi:hypothetical protein